MTDTIDELQVRLYRASLGIKRLSDELAAARRALGALRVENTHLKSRLGASSSGVTETRDFTRHTPDTCPCPCHLADRSTPAPTVPRAATAPETPSSRKPRSST